METKSIVANERNSLYSTYCKGDLSLIFLFLILAAGFIVFSVLAGARGDSEKELNAYYIEFQGALKSNEFKTSLLISSATAFPVTVDLILCSADILLFNRKNKNKSVGSFELVHWAFRLILLVCLVLPNFLLYAGNVYESGTADVYAFLAVELLKHLAIWCSALAYVVSNHRQSGIKSLSVAACLVLLVAYIIRYFAVVSSSSSISLYIVSTVLSAIVYVTFLVICFRWMQSLRQKYTEDHVIEGKDFAVIMYLICVFILVAQDIILTVVVFRGADSVLSFSPFSSCLTAYMALQTVFAVIIVMVPARVAQMGLVDAHRIMDMRQDFISYISHEIRSPLNTVSLGMAYVDSELKTMRETASLREMVKDMMTSCDAAVSVLDDLLTVDKIDSGRMQLELQEKNPLLFLTEVCNPYNVSARHKNIDFSLDLSSCYRHQSQYNQLVIRIDEHKFSQVVRNLMSNAIKFTPEGGKVTVTVTVETYRVRSNGTMVKVVGDSASGMLNSHGVVQRFQRVPSVFISRIAATGPGAMAVSHMSSIGHILASHRDRDVAGDNGSSGGRGSNLADPTQKEKKYKKVLRLEVKDSGAGISPENQKMMFRQYMQFNAGKLQKGNGSGLGLWISKRIVDLHGGKISVESEGESKGSTFIVLLPLAHKGNNLQPNSSMRSGRQIHQGGGLDSNDHALFSSRFVSHGAESPPLRRHSVMASPELPPISPISPLSSPKGKRIMSISTMIGEQQQQMMMEAMVRGGGPVAGGNDNSPPLAIYPKITTTAATELLLKDEGAYADTHAALYANPTAAAAAVASSKLFPSSPNAGAGGGAIRAIENNISSVSVLDVASLPLSPLQGGGGGGGEAEQGGGGGEQGGGGGGEQGGGGGGDESRPPDRVAVLSRIIAQNQGETHLIVAQDDNPDGRGGGDGQIQEQGQAAAIVYLKDYIFPSRPHRGGWRSRGVRPDPGLTAGTGTGTGGTGTGTGTGGTGTGGATPTPADSRRGSVSSLASGRSSFSLTMRSRINSVHALLGDVNYGVSPRAQIVADALTAAAAAAAAATATTTTAGAVCALSALNGDDDSGIESRTSRVPRGAAGMLRRPPPARRGSNGSSGGASMGSSASGSSIMSNISAGKNTGIAAVGAPPSYSGGSSSSLLMKALRTTVTGIGGTNGGSSIHPQHQHHQPLSVIQEVVGISSPTSPRGPHQEDIGGGDADSSSGGGGSSSGVAAAADAGSGRSGGSDGVGAGGSRGGFWGTITTEGGGRGGGRRSAAASNNTSVRSGAGNNDLGPIDEWGEDHKSSTSNNGGGREHIKNRESPNPTRLSMMDLVASKNSSAAPSPSSSLALPGPRPGHGPRPGPGPGPAGGLRFLVADDSATTRKVMVRILTAKKHTVTEAVDGRDCVRKYEAAVARSDTFDVVLMDDNMPNLSGPEAAQKLRQIGYAGLIMAITGNVHSGDVDNFKAHGADEVFPKPLSLDCLMNCLQARGLIYS